MRRKDREIKNKNELIEIFEKADVCRIAINSEIAPYIVPLNFGYKWKDKIEIYFHCALEGRKIELLAKNNIVGFEIDIDHELIKSEKACNWGMKYKSIIGIGKIIEIIDYHEKKEAFNQIMRHYGSKKDKIEYDEIIFNKTQILKLIVKEMTGKRKI
jgi:nitroimidazol reductase NimA-like FMN-containing flavoprotein (pyridoxamine 5'-phosphate oxidase superfamily)